MLTQFTYVCNRSTLSKTLRIKLIGLYNNKNTLKVGHFYFGCENL